MPSKNELTLLEDYNWKKLSNLNLNQKVVYTDGKNIVYGIIIEINDNFSYLADYYVRIQWEIDLDKYGKDESKYHIDECQNIYLYTPQAKNIKYKKVISNIDGYTEEDEDNFFSEVEEENNSSNYSDAGYDDGYYTDEESLDIDYKKHFESYNYEKINYSNIHKLKEGDVVFNVNVEALVNYNTVIDYIIDYSDITSFGQVSNIGYGLYHILWNIEESEPVKYNLSGLVNGGYFFINTETYKKKKPKEKYPEKDKNIIDNSNPFKYLDL